MRIMVNGVLGEVDDDATLGSVVAAELPDVAVRRGVAVALDRQVVRRSQWDDTALAEGSQIEIVTAVQGG